MVRCTSNVNTHLVIAQGDSGSPTIAQQDGRLFVEHIMGNSYHPWNPFTLVREEVCLAYALETI